MSYGIIPFISVMLGDLPENAVLKSAKNELENIKQFTVDEFQNMIKVFIFVIEEIIIKYHKETMNANQANKLMNHWLTCFITGIRCICQSMEIFFKIGAGDF
uniref:Uncharacterized protein n=1 Tax=Rhizophagus irregularis (strain DAOM 181602 / DAOM 197198 / MUCL 43194) TaxID=747089 RepID=U9T6Q5_RHIID